MPDAPPDALDALTYGPLRTYAALEACEALQRLTWGPDDRPAPADLMAATQKVGALALGAHTPDGTLVGASFGVLGLYEGEVVHWSHMTAVHPDWRGRGLGLRLKHAQRTHVLGQGVRLMLWTYDPLAARNAHLNLNRLGVEVLAYERDVYGPGQSALHAGLGTDRFLVRWRLDAPRTERLLKQPPPPADAALRRAALAPPGGPFPHADVVRIAVPADVQRFKADDPEGAQAARLHTRAAFEHYLGNRYRVAVFYRDADADLGYYVLLR